MPKTPEPTTPTHADIHAAILAIYQEGKLYAQKASKNSAQGYTYTSEADFLALIRPQLAEHGVICHPKYSVLHEGQLTTKSGSVMQTITILGTFTFTHAPSRTFIEVITIGQGADQQDKAAYKAMTGAQKYAVRQAFMIETGDDPEKDETSEPTLGTVHPFIADLDFERGRIGDKPYARVLTSFGVLAMTPVPELLALPKETKHALIAALRQEPPF